MRFLLVYKEPYLLNRSCYWLLKGFTKGVAAKLKFLKFLRKLTVTNSELSKSKAGYTRLMDSVKYRTGLDKRQQFSVALNEFLVKEKSRRGYVAFIQQQ